MKNPEPDNLWFDIAFGVWVGGLMLVVTLVGGVMALGLLVEFITWALV